MIECLFKDEILCEATRLHPNHHTSTELANICLHAVSSTRVLCVCVRAFMHMCL